MAQKSEKLLYLIKEEIQRLAFKIVDLNNNVESVKNVIYEVTYKEIIDITGGTTGSITFPNGATLDEEDYPGNSYLTTLEAGGEITGVSPRNTTGEIITSSLDSNGDWITTDITNSSVAIIFNLKIKAVDALNLDDSKVIDLFKVQDSIPTNQGFIDYNDTTGNVTLVANTWTDIPNDGNGAFSNSTYKPEGVTNLLDVNTGYINTSELQLGDSILIRNDYSVTPNTNNALLEFRYQLGNGGGTYTLEKIVGRLDSGSGNPYRFSLEPDLIYMGDSNTKDNAIKLQVKLSSNGVLNNAGSVIQVIRK